ncbi:hypothetical protein [Paraburkholderia dilworthii]|uniref:hypothetical protein n=1 Tax=Paraburkholderia dilworthii TaxID=948106 RepID=UPI00126789A1|nr:hypothetical protein [Paraburkholderia dilworthii]
MRIDAYDPARESGNGPMARRTFSGGRLNTLCRLTAQSRRLTDPTGHVPASGDLGQEAIVDFLLCNQGTTQARCAERALNLSTSRTGSFIVDSRYWYDDRSRLVKAGKRSLTE